MTVRKGFRVTEEEAALWVRAWEGGKPCRDIATAAGRDYNTVLRWLKKLTGQWGSGLSEPVRSLRRNGKGVESSLDDKEKSAQTPPEGARRRTRRRRKKRLRREERAQLAADLEADLAAGEGFPPPPWTPADSGLGFADVMQAWAWVQTHVFPAAGAPTPSGMALLRGVRDPEARLLACLLALEGGEAWLRAAASDDRE
jgi:hypothetical protein